MLISALVYAIVDPPLSLFYLATGMSSKKKAAITDRATAKKAKAYIYGVKELRKLEAVKKMQIYLESYDKTKDEQSKRNSFYINITSALTVVVRLTLLFLYLYMVWSFIIY